jgi:catechol 2,3-dioxygenase-like lactoylglutathione lyase family enzyme
MEYQINMLTLGVNDLEGMTEWYKEKFGWMPVRGADGTIFFKLEGLLLALIPENELARDISVWQDGLGFKRFAFTICFNSEEEVDRIFDELQEKGVMIIKEPEKIYGGIYRGYITDPENNFWELAFYPFMEMGKANERFWTNEIVYQ